MISLIGQILCSALKNLFENQPDIFDFTSQTGQTEWNLTHHLANEIHKYIFWLDHDLDVTKRNLGNKRPDIIFHKRGTNALNFLVVEVKYRDTSVEKDIRKIKEDWMENELKYRFGASIKIVDKNEYKVILLDRKDDKWSNNQEIKFLPVSKLSNPIRNEIDQKVNKILSFTQSQDYVKEYERQIDQLVYKLYNLTEEEIKIVEDFEKNKL